MLKISLATLALTIATAPAFADDVYDVDVINSPGAVVNIQVEHAPEPRAAAGFGQFCATENGTVWIMVDLPLGWDCMVPRLFDLPDFGYVVAE